MSCQMAGTDGELKGGFSKGSFPSIRHRAEGFDMYLRSPGFLRRRNGRVSMILGEIKGTQY